MAARKLPPNYPLRIKDDVRKNAQTEAEKCRWSLNTWITVAIEEKLERDKELVA